MIRNCVQTNGVIMWKTLDRRRGEEARLCHFVMLVDEEVAPVPKPHLRFTRLAFCAGTPELIIGIPGDGKILSSFFLFSFFFCFYE